ncbi:ectonucleotide pyrophosphatase/phosphodiesterase family member 3 [Daphnia magna]|uniref:ectonucleotide pyrophosphatase/phosphodiesterase family member 3 n=1 Tax=Daphnia magna TaxID=35525 RepID=UPI001E1BB193|nr:ectonucleotide pyrophosphatase/phosphodiesterase family member 3 [Daphnia magna]
MLYPTTHDLTPLLLIFQAMWCMGASIPAPTMENSKTTEQHFAQESCSFLQESSQEECPSFWAQGQPPVILISLDGFRAEYLSRFALENTEHRGEFAATTIRCLAERGVSSPYMMPSYPTITFPNHYAIVTGLYPESHGIIGNQFYDPDLRATFSIYTDGTDPKWWQNGEPIWTTVRRQGKVSATYFWPGSDVKFAEEEQRSPNYFFRYNKTTSFRQRVDQVLEWMDLPADKRPALTTLYFEEPDSTGHKAGPNTANVTEKVTVVDRQIRRLIDGLLARNIANCVNIIVVSDHGMADSPPGKQLVDLEKYVPDIQQSALTFLGPVTSIRPLNETQEEEDRIGDALSCKDPRMRVFNKWELPYRMHSVRSRRIPNLMLDMDLSWRAVIKQEAWSGGGAHGWDNVYLDMQAIFIAHGPSFKNQEVVRPFENIQLYNLICHLVNVTPAENNGTWGALHHLLSDPPNLLVDADQEFPDMPQILRKLADTREEKDKPSACAYVNHKETEKTSPAMEIEMKMTEERENELFIAHAPLGIPIVIPTEPSPSNLFNDPNHVLLVNEDYLTGFDVELGIPLWTAYTISGNTTNNINDGHWIEDPRLDQNHTGSCQRLSNIVRRNEVAYTHLFPKEFATQKVDAWLDTNLLEVPSSISHFLETMTDMLAEASISRGPLNVISGPTRHRPASIFYVVTACKVDVTVGEWNHTTCPAEYRDLQAFLLPIGGWKYQGACTSDRNFIAYNVASLIDVEQVTGFQFFPDLPLEDKLSLLARTTLDSALVLDPTRY